MSEHRVAGSRWRGWGSGIAIIFTLAVLLTTVPMPFTGDQALFALGAEELRRGGVLYVDFWDLKQPAVFWFFTMSAGEPVRAHVIELLWQLALVAVLFVASRGLFTAGWIRSLVPLIVAWPYLSATPDVLTQVEMLVGLPLLVGLVLVDRLSAEPSSGATRWLAVGAGLALFVVAMFKLMYVPVLVGGWAAMFLVMSGPRRRVVWRSARWIALGVGVPLVLYLALATIQGGLEATLRTWFEVPLGATERVGRSPQRHIDTAATFLWIHAPVVLLAALGAARVVRRHDEPIAAGIVAWIVVGSGTLVLQLGWYYLTSLLLVPLGILALMGVDALVGWLGTAERRLRLGLVVLALLVLVLPTSQRFGRRLDHLADSGFAVSADDRESFQNAEWRLLGAQTTAASMLDAASQPGDVVVVWDDPLILLLSGRRNAISINGWSPEHLDQRLWRRAEDEMRSVRPDLILVGVIARTRFDERATGIVQFLDEEYEAVDGGVDGEAVLYRRSVD